MFTSTTKRKSKPRVSAATREALARRIENTWRVGIYPPWDDPSQTIVDPVWYDYEHASGRRIVVFPTRTPEGEAPVAEFKVEAGDPVATFAKWWSEHKPKPRKR